MSSRSLFSPVLLACLVLLGCVTCPLSGARSLLAAPSPVPENTISITFDPVRGTMTGTSRIVVPPDTDLTLLNSGLVITGALLEPDKRAPLQVRPGPDNTLTIPASDTVQTLFVSWSLTAPAGMQSDNLISEDGITLAGLWHPLPDRNMLYTLEARLPRGFTGISEATASGTRVGPDGSRIFTSRFDHPVRGIHFVAGPYKVTSRGLDNGVTLRSYFFAEDQALASEYLEKTATYIKRFQELIGPYPYSSYAVVENRLPTGYGMPTFTLLGQAVVRLPFIKDTSLGHEVLHSWFGNSVHVAEEGGNWCEGLTTYLADQMFAEEKGEGATYRKNQLLRYDAYVPRDNSIALEQFVNASDSQPMARQVRAVGYDKGAMVFHMLRRRLGDDLFFAALRHFFQNYRYQSAGWEELEQSFSTVSGRDLTLFFEQWLRYIDIPKLVISAVDVSQENGESVITFTLRQASVEPYDLDLPVVVTTAGESIRNIVRVTDREQEVRVTVPDLPVSMAVDPDYDLMRALPNHERPPIWAQFMGAADRTVVLPPAETEEIYRPLLPVLEKLGCTLIPAEELTTEALTDGDYLFLGSMPQSLGLFGDAGHPDRGFTLEVRKNPLDPDRVVVLVSSSSGQETAAAAYRLKHYGRYGLLRFLDGRIMEKRTKPADQGIRVRLFDQPLGIRVPDISSFDAIIDELQKKRVIYAGETHTDMGDHLLQLQIIQALYNKNSNLAIGLEMFPRSAQEVLDAYISGDIATEREFLKKSDYFTVWGYDYRLYAEIIGYARKKRIPLVALNIDKKIVDQVFRDGHFDGIEEEQKIEVPVERRLDIPGYRERLIQAFSGHGKSSFTPDRLAGFIQAQSVWDEAMAESIVNYLTANPDRQLVVIAGNGHTYKDTGIPARVKRRLDIDQSVVTSAGQGMTGRETGYQADYLIYTRPLKLTPAPKVGVILEKETMDEQQELTRVRIKQISPHGKAGEAGLRENDLILTIDGEQIHDINDVRLAVFDKEAGDRVTVRVLRERTLFPDQELDIEVELSTPMGAGRMIPPHPK